MAWLLAGIIAPLLWATVNHVDKYLLSKTKHKSSVEVLMVYSTWFSLLVLPFLFYFSYTKLFSSWQQIIVQVVGGVFLSLSIYFYLKALRKDEASIVMPFAMLVPVFGYVFSFILLGEGLSAKQVIACLIIMIGALTLSIDFEQERKMRIKHGVLWFMVLCAGFQAAQETLFKFVTIQNSYVVSLFWLHVGIAITGLVLVVAHRGLWGHFVESIKVNGAEMFGVNIVSEAMSGAAYAVQGFAVLLAPVAVIMTLNGYQPVFVFVLGIILTILAPKLVSERIKPIHLFHKTLAILIILGGTIMLAQTLS